MNQNQQIMHEKSHFAFKKIVSLVERYNEDVQFAFISQFRHSFEQESIYIVNKELFLDYINDDILIITSHQKLPHASKKELMQRMNLTSFEYPSFLEKTKTGCIKYQAKYEWCVQHSDIIAPIAYPELVTVQLSDLLQNSIELLREYFLRKFCDTLYNHKIQVPYGSEFSDFVMPSFNYPDDIVTEMLNYYGHNRCENYTPPRTVYAAKIAKLDFVFSFKDIRAKD